MCENDSILPIEQKDNEELVEDYSYTWPSNDYGDMYPAYSVYLSDGILDFNKNVITQASFSY
jgi:hypothetical protein